jgi:hypothetical protein
MTVASIVSSFPWFRLLPANNALPIQAWDLLGATVTPHAVGVILALGRRLLLDLLDDFLVVPRARLALSDVGVVPVAAEALLAIGVVLAVVVGLRLWGLLLALFATDNALAIQTGDVLVAAVASGAVGIILALGRWVFNLVNLGNFGQLDPRTPDSFAGLALADKRVVEVAAETLLAVGVVLAVVLCFNLFSLLHVFDLFTTSADDTFAKSGRIGAAVTSGAFIVVDASRGGIDLGFGLGLLSTSAGDAVALEPWLDGRAAEASLAVEVLDALGRQSFRFLGPSAANAVPDAARWNCRTAIAALAVPVEVAAVAVPFQLKPFDRRRVGRDGALRKRVDDDDGEK